MGKKKEPDKLQRHFGPPITSIGMAFAVAAERQRKKREEEEYARGHGGRKVPARKKQG